MGTVDFSEMYGMNFGEKFVYVFQHTGGILIGMLIVGFIVIYGALYIVALKRNRMEAKMEKEERRQALIAKYKKNVRRDGRKLVGFCKTPKK